MLVVCTTLKCQCVYIFLFFPRPFLADAALVYFLYVAGCISVRLSLWDSKIQVECKIKQEFSHQYKVRVFILTVGFTQDVGERTNPAITRGKADDEHSRTGRHVRSGENRTRMRRVYRFKQHSNHISALCYHKDINIDVASECARESLDLRAALLSTLI